MGKAGAVTTGHRVLLALLTVHGALGSRGPAARGEARPFGLAWPWGRRTELWLWGTPTAPPLVLCALQAAVVVAGRGRSAHSLARASGMAIVVGQLSEPVVYRFAHEDRLTRRRVVANVVLAALVALPRPSKRATGDQPPA
jgi:hypothetical protein